MKIYIDLLLIFNFIIDLVLLLSVAGMLKRKLSFYRVIFASFIGSFSILFLFIKLNNFQLFVLKLVISVVMIIVAFKFINLKYFFKNIIYLYLNSIFLGGFIYFINNALFLNNNNFKFISNSYQLNFYLMTIITPIIISYYVRRMKTITEYHNYRFYTTVKYHDQEISGIGFLDSANTLKYKRKMVILVSHNLLNFEVDDYILLPYQALNHIGLVKCFMIDYLKYNNRVLSNVYLGIMDNEIGFDGVDFLLHKEMIEG